MPRTNEFATVPVPGTCIWRKLTTQVMIDSPPSELLIRVCRAVSPTLPNLPGFRRDGSSFGADDFMVQAVRDGYAEIYSPLASIEAPEHGIPLEFQGATIFWNLTRRLCLVPRHCRRSLLFSSPRDCIKCLKLAAADGFAP
jgi:hypothetical protein